MRSSSWRRRIVSSASALAVVCASILVAVPAQAASTTYYVDSVSGSDANIGTSATSPWKTLDKVTSTSFAPGDRILLKGGSQWTGSVTLSSSGTASAPIVLGSYGTGRPRIDANTTVRNAVQVVNAKHVTVENLEVTNSSNFDESTTNIYRGIYVEAKDIGEVPGIVIRNNYVHHVDGRGRSGGIGNGGIAVGVRGNTVATWYSGLRITGNQVADIHAYGISTFTTWCGGCEIYPGETGIPTTEVSSTRKPYTGLLIDQNYVLRVSGGGITPQYADDAVVEWNTVDSAASYQVEHGNGNVGIWWQGTNGILVQYNTVRRTAATGIYQTVQPVDAMAFDADMGTSNSTVQYNISQGNNGGFFMCLISANKNVVRNNLSVGDHRLGFRLLSGCYGTKAYNNTMWAPSTPTPTLTSTGEPGTPVASEGIVVGEGSNGHVLTNNIIYNPANAPFSTDASYSNNLYWSGTAASTTVPAGDTTAVIADPALTNPAAALPESGFITQAQFAAYFAAFAPASASPALNKGVSLNGQTKDALGTPFAAGRADLGAVQHAVSATASTSLGTSMGSLQNIVDGDLSTSWASADAPTLPGTIDVTFGAAREFDAVTIATAFGQGQGATKVDVQTWNGTTWVTSVADATPTWSSNSQSVEHARIQLPAAVTTSKVRIVVKSANLTWSHVAVNELSFSYRGAAASNLKSRAGTSLANLVDNTPSTSWAASSSSLGYIQLDSQRVTARSITIKVAFGQGQGPTRISVQALDGDRGNWTSVLASTPLTWSSNSATVESRTLTFSQPITATRFEVKIESANQQWGAVAINDIVIN